MRNGGTDSAVRILPAGNEPPPTPDEPRPDRKWFVPLLAVAAVVGVFVAATRPTASDTATGTTEPSRIAAIDAERVDLTIDRDDLMNGPWEGTTFAEWGDASTAFRAGSLLVAINNTEGPAGWTTTSGSDRLEFSRLGLPDGERATIDHAVAWDRGLYAIGQVGDGYGAWSSSGVRMLDYRGKVTFEGSAAPEHLVAGPGLLAVSGPNERKSWFSSSGQFWGPAKGISDLDELTVSGFTGNAEAFYAFGAESCDEPAILVPSAETGCAAAVYRSADGASWDRVLFSSELRSAIVDVAVTDDGFVAVGWEAGLSGAAIAMWVSDNGESWEKLDATDTSLQPALVSLAVLQTQGDEAPWAELSVDGQIFEVTTGTKVDTTAGILEVVAIAETSVTLRDGVGGGPISADTAVDIRSTPVPVRLAIEGDRWVVVGRAQLSSERSVPMAWLSYDAGRTWTRETLDDADGTALFPFVRSHNIVVVGTTPGGSTVWRSRWDTTTLTEHAESSVSQYLEALNRSDSEALLGLLPETTQLELAPTFMIPTLGEIEHGFWNESGELDAGSVQNVLDYLMGQQLPSRSQSAVRGHASPTWTRSTCDANTTPTRICLRCSMRLALARSRLWSRLDG